MKPGLLETNDTTRHGNLIVRKEQILSNTSQYIVSGSNGNVTGNLIVPMDQTKIVFLVVTCVAVTIHGLS